MSARSGPVQFSQGLPWCDRGRWSRGPKAEAALVIAFPCFSLAWELGAFPIGYRKAPGYEQVE